MLTLPSSVRIFIAVEAADMRCGFDRLAAMTQTVLDQDPLSGHLFVFFSRHRDRCKILFWDRSGYCLWYKRLESGTFQLPQQPSSAKRIEMDMAKLSLILEGIDICHARHRKRFKLASHTS
jgi:transposase